MGSIFVEIAYSTLVEIVPRLISIVLPLLGAFWIYKIREKAAAEAKIFELGREIANLIQSFDMRGPVDGICYSFIDRALVNSDELNRDKAIGRLLRENLPAKLYSEDPDERYDASVLVIAIATNRILRLVPYTVTWSGRGVAYSTFGERINVEDSFFPFGTKLYREWTVLFSDLYNDLFAILHSRRVLTRNFLEKQNWVPDIDKDFMETWFEKIGNGMKDLRPLHAKLLTQIQIIDSQIDLERLKKGIIETVIYCVLILISGYLIPRFLMLSEALTGYNMVWVGLSTVIVGCMVVRKIAVLARPRTEKYLQRKIFLPGLIDSLERMEHWYLKYKFLDIKNVISLESDMRLGKRITQNLGLLCERISSVNHYGEVLLQRVEVGLADIERDFPTSRVNQQSFGLKVTDFLIDLDDCERIHQRVLSEIYNFTIETDEMDSSRGILSVNLSDLDDCQRAAFWARICDLRDSIRADVISTSVNVAMEEFQACRLEVLGQVRKKLAESNQKS
ncbi:hypothetical protein E4634_08455 [Mangrovimicrobium sediminis]|uniref:Uncharacterized protein n=1 Tax=Mangrovimicrobium sediminis TaxID=2562682 RepID=A0A4Z0M387_9GAMM|nr:hypothetical protein [Haliea sp. SAOS-164]TGD74153.1 hypothetical protein E4634_08455 [Haliea sp. SAOS-164]